MGAVVFAAPAKVLLIRRANEPHKGWWSLPGGLVETGELVRDAIKREVLEETGLTVETGAIVEVFERILHDEEGRVEHHYVVVDFLCEVVAGTLATGDDASEAAWFGLAELPGLQLTEGASRVIEKALALP